MARLYSLLRAMGDDDGESHKKLQLWLCHTACFVWHTAWSAATLFAGWGKPMEVRLFRMKAVWRDMSRDGFDFYAVPTDVQLRIDVLTFTFFALSATAHGLWTFTVGTPWNENYLWKPLKRGRAWW